MPSLAIILTQEYADWEFAPIAAMGKDYYDYDVQICSPGAAPVISMAGLVSHPQNKLEDVKAENFDALIIIGGKIWQADNFPNMTPFIEDFLRSKKTVAGICGATLALARAGILDDRKHTSNNGEYLAEFVSHYKGEHFYIDTDKAVSDKNVISASGFTPHHFAAEIYRATGLDEAEIVDYLDSLGAEFK